MKISRLNIQNYRTLENIDMKFSESFTAICGPNDCGKTNVVRVIRALMRDQDRYAYQEIEEITAKDNFPKWKQLNTTDRSIQFTLGIVLDKDRDVGLYQFTVKHLSLGDQPPTLTFEMTVVYQSEKSEPQVSVKVGDKVVDGIEAQQVLKTLRSSRTVLFHNSTRPEPRYVGRGMQGFLSEISGESQAHFDSMKKSVDRTLKKVAKKHQEQIEELLGRLEAKYRVGLSLPDFDLGFLPYNITLGQKQRIRMGWC